jgi:acetyl esterase/lipase
VAVTIDYALVPTVRFPAPLDDVRTALRWVRTNAARLGVDPTRVALVGGSAGGHLALLEATTARQAADRPTTVVSWSGPTDLTTPGPLARLVRGLLGCDPRLCARRAAAASPLRHVDRLDPPTLLVHSTREVVPLAQAVAMDARLAAAGVAHRLVTVPGRAHSTELGDRAWRPTVAYLDRVLGRPVC